eukprot:TRINITY_DN1519_c0_g1_i1.p1 TRINITY_DN1519_c0_g1~~TRINITY_DN1519_c0_g1_i1.p1  ORF type:complete len:136 (-),score=61.36 TRINITY_DN1519_c0_g1_i1:154-561(-)
MERVFKSPIAEPMASEKLTDAILKFVRKLAVEKDQVKRGVKEVVKTIRRKKARNGLVVICGDISPVDVISHVPVFCEENDVPYIYVPSREALGVACRTKRPTSCAILIPGAEFKYLEKYQQLVEKVKKVNPYVKC